MTFLLPSQERALLDLRERYLAPCWEWTHAVHYDTGFVRKEPKPTIACTYLCRHTSAVVLDLLRAVEPEWRLDGGEIATREGTPPQPHWWLTNGQAIVDLTAEQFGWEPLVITDASDTRYRSLPGANGAHWIKGLKTALLQWQGTPSREWMLQDARFQAVLAALPERERFQAAWVSEDPSPRRGLRAP